jgi:hypothetical protein
MDALDLAYAAGIIDGEGSIQIVKHNDPSCIVGYKYWLNVTVGMTDPQAVTHLHEMFGGNFSQLTRHTKGGRIVYRWSITTRAAAALLIILHPYLKVKKEQAEIAAKFQEFQSKVRGPKPQSDLDAQERLRLKLKQLHLH